MNGACLQCTHVESSASRYPRSSSRRSASELSSSRLACQRPPQVCLVHLYITERDWLTSEAASMSTIQLSTTYEIHYLIKLIFVQLKVLHVPLNVSRLMILSGTSNVICFLLCIFLLCQLACFIITNNNNNNNSFISNIVDNPQLH